MNGSFIEIQHSSNLLLWSGMKKICLFISISLCSWLGWEAGASWGIMTAYWISFFGSLLGVILGVLINRRFLDF
jgi:cytosine/uracil/thiamine/allantoin permease